MYLFWTSGWYDMASLDVCGKTLDKDMSTVMGEASSNKSFVLLQLHAEGFWQKTKNSWLNTVGYGKED